MRFRSQIGDAGGFSIIEVMIGTLIFSVLAGSAMRFLMIQQRSFTRLERSAEVQQQLRAAADFMGRELALVGFGLPPDQSGLLKAEEQEIDFLANLDNEVAHLAWPSRPGDRILRVVLGEFKPGQDFEAGKRIVICGPDRCEWNTLARDGKGESLDLIEPIQNTHPAGSTVQVINRVRYTLTPDKDARFKLIRTVDGGPGPVAEGLSAMRLDYLNREGSPETGIDRIRLVRIGLTAEATGGPRIFRSVTGAAHFRNQ